jgi:hypothetical protein
MTPLDLRTTPPRSPYDELADMVMLARTVDKARGLLPGGNRGQYWISPGVSAWLIGKLGFNEESFVAFVGSADDEAAVSAEVERRADADRRKRWDAGMREMTVAALGPEFAKLVPQIYGPVEPDERILDVIVRDDALFVSEAP